MPTRPKVHCSASGDAYRDLYKDPRGCGPAPPACEAVNANQSSAPSPPGMGDRHQQRQTYDRQRDRQE